MMVTLAFNGLNGLTNVTSRNYRQFINALILENCQHYPTLSTFKNCKNFLKLFLC